MTEQTYFRKGFGLRGEIAEAVLEAHPGGGDAEEADALVLGPGQSSCPHEIVPERARVLATHRRVAPAQIEVRGVVEVEPEIVATRVDRPHQSIASGGREVDLGAYVIAVKARTADISPPVVGGIHSGGAGVVDTVVLVSQKIITID